MKKLLTVSFLFITLLSYGQSFEGTITYVVDVTVSKQMIDMGVTKESLLTRMRAEGSWADTIQSSYKGGNYYNLLLRKEKQWSIYRADKNKMYTMQDGEDSDICIVTDASIDLEHTMTGKMRTVELLDSTATVNGIVCKIVRVKWNTGNTDYYYDPSQLPMDPSLYTPHVAEGWGDYLKLSKALPLKITKGVSGIMTVTLTMVSAEKKPIDDKLFLIPVLVKDKDLNIIKMKNSEMMRIKK
ncbi:MAG: hypothetical protein K0R51_3215 [Cytophagaceae bacterium]|jgi:hypothetical protein|nr:hypothetical protein [Cytophagaceae bacterium]